jgi:hypothetical protein
MQYENGGGFEQHWPEAGTLRVGELKHGVGGRRVDEVEKRIFLIPVQAN